MGNRIYLEANPYQVRVALTEDDALAELYIERKGGERIDGNIYKGKVKNVLPGMQAAFVDIGLDKNAFLYAGDIINIAERDDFRFNGKPAEETSTLDIRSMVKTGQEIMVQVIKEPFGTKGARITTNITLPGRSIVLMPNADYVGVSRRIENEEDRTALREVLERIRPPHIGVIARTVSLGLSEEALHEQIDQQMRLYRQIMLHYEEVKSPCLVHSEESLVYRTVRDMLRDDIQAFLVNDAALYQRIVQTVKVMSPHLVDRIRLFHKHYDMFAYYDLESKIEKALRRKVWLKSGSYLVFDSAEALTVIDVNTGKYVGTNDLQSTILHTNIEAAQEVARQIRVRDISGIIAVDFIDMEDAANREKLLEVLREATKRDRTRTSIMGITGLGIVEMTRKKLKQSLSSVFYESCPYCDGLGILKNKSTMAMEARKECLKLFYDTDCKAVIIKGHPVIIAEVMSMTKPEARLIPLVQNKMVYVMPCDNMHWEHLEVEPVYNLQDLRDSGAVKLP